MTLLLAAALDILLFLGVANLQFVEQSLRLLLSLGLLVAVVVGVGIGALGAYLCARWQTQVYLNQASLWALVLCLAACLLVKTVLPLPQILVSASLPAILGMAIGVFWQARSRWR